MRPSSSAFDSGTTSTTITPFSDEEIGRLNADRALRDIQQIELENQVYAALKQQPHTDAPEAGEDAGAEQENTVVGGEAFRHGVRLRSAVISGSC